MQSKPSVHEAALHVFWMMVRVLCNCGQELASLGTGWCTGFSQCMGKSLLSNIKLYST
jgi:hypothetical protein